MFAITYVHSKWNHYTPVLLKNEYEWIIINFVCLLLIDGYLMNQNDFLTLIQDLNFHKNETTPPTTTNQNVFGKPNADE